MPENTKPPPTDKFTVAVIKGGPLFQAWFRSLQDHTRLPAALLLDAALVVYARSISFDPPPPR